MLQGLDIQQLKQDYVYKNASGNFDDIKRHQKIVDRQFIENFRHLPVMIFPDEKYTKFSTKRGENNLITPFVLVEEDIFDHKPSAFSTQFGGVRQFNKTSHDHDG